MWTFDNWATTVEAQAHWDGNVPNSFGSEDETWYVEVLHYPQSRVNLHLRYVLYVDDAKGNRQWDNNGGWNYELVVDHF
jgi:hypothetical protein